MADDRGAAAPAPASPRVPGPDGVVRQAAMRRSNLGLVLREVLDAARPRLASRHRRDAPA